MPPRAIPCSVRSMISRVRIVGLVVPAVQQEGDRARDGGTSAGCRTRRSPGRTPGRSAPPPPRAMQAMAHPALLSSRCVVQHPPDRLRLGLHLAPAGTVGVEHARRARSETRGCPYFAVRREVGAAVEDLAVGREEGGERPAALAGERLHRALIAGVHVGPLVAVHLDADEVLVEDSGRWRDPRRTRRPSRGTSGTTRRRCRAAPAGPGRGRRRTPPHPRGYQWIGWWAADCR